MVSFGFSGSRRQHLHRLWQEVLVSSQLPQIDKWLADKFRKNARYGSRDRRWYSEMLFAAMRHGYVALFLQNATARRLSVSVEMVENFAREFASPESVLNAWKVLDPNEFFAHVWRVYELGDSALDEAPASDDVLASISHARAFSDLQAQARAGHLLSQMLLSSVPLWLFFDFEKRVLESGWSSELAQKFLASQVSRPPLWLRLNHADKRELVLSTLHGDGFGVEEFGGALCVKGERGIFLSEAYKQGWVEIQDYASQEAGKSVCAIPGNVVWDACAGGGGKTLQIASRLQNRGAVYASDVREFKLEEVKKRARRAGFFNVRCQAWDGVDIPAFPREVEKRGGFDWVLVDAPCSSSGTWRRNPDAKYRIHEGSVAEIVELQLKILSNASRAVAANGKLVYSTCSWLVDENESVVRKFIDINPNFSLESMNLLGTPNVDSDTLFAAVLVRRTIS